MNYIYRNIMMTLVLALVPFMGISAKRKAVQQSDRIFYCFFNTGAPFSQEIVFLQMLQEGVRRLPEGVCRGTEKWLISMISRGNPLFFRTFPRLINTIFLSLFCAKWLFYPISRKIVIHYFARNDIFGIFAAK